jgi:hypothetical protein
MIVIGPETRGIDLNHVAAGETHHAAPDVLLSKPLGGQP